MSYDEHEESNLYPVGNTRRGKSRDHARVIIPSSKSPYSHKKKNNIPDIKGVEDVLISNGYILEREITVNNNIGESNFVLAINKRGQYVMIDLNDDRHRGKDGRVIHSTKIEYNKPFSTRKGDFECSSGICGVAYDGSNELNITLRDDMSSDPVSVVFKHSTENTVSVGGNIPIPLISYSDLVHEPGAILVNTYETTDILYKNLYENCKKGMHESSLKLSQLDKSMKDYISREAVNAEKLANSISKLREMAFEYEADPPIDEESKNKYNVIKYNLKKRTDMFIALIKCCEKFTEYNSEINDTIDKINSLNDLCSREFQGVGSVIPM